MKNKKAQLTLFIIISIFIVALLLIIFWPKVKTIFIPSSPEIDFQKCIENDLKKELILIASSGGSKDPKLYYSYQGNKIEYLCYTNENYKTCVMQQPLLKQHIERELIDELKPKINLCIENIKKSAESQGYKINYIKNSPSIEILQNNVKLSLDTDIVLEKDSKIRITKLESKIPSKIYDLIIISSSILNLEAKYGDTDILTYMIYYPEIKIEKYRQNDGTKIYILTNKNTNEKLVFATRSLNFPGGYGIVV